ncbi:hypothetical protein Trydic_g14093, partial [Trypoxylus dichotomus]
IHNLLTVLIAVPVSAIYKPPPPVVFKADHPFLFILTADMKETYYGTFQDPMILLVGKVTKPEVIN